MKKLLIALTIITGIMCAGCNNENELQTILKSKKYIDQNVEVTGWYRRAPIPYIEIKTLSLDGKVKKCYTYLSIFYNRIIN